MPFSVECPCGRVIPTDTPSLPPGAVCPRCGRDPMVLALRPQKKKSSFRSFIVIVGLTAVITAVSVAAIVLRINAVMRAEAALAAAAVVPPPAAVPAPPQPVPEPVIAEPPPKVEPPPPPPAPVPEKPKEKEQPRPLLPEGRLEPEQQKPARFAVGKEIEQEVLVNRRSIYSVLGIQTVQDATYSLTSKLAVVANAKDGCFTVKQTVTATKLHAADDTFRPLLAEALQKSEGATFDITVNDAGEVTAFAAPKNAVKVQEGKTADGGPTLRVWSILDADAWRELAVLSFLDPSNAKPNDSWTRPLRHDWGHLGSWSGQTVFLAKGKVQNLDRVDFRHDMKYLPPPAGVESGLPVRIVNPQFRTERAGGAVLFDAKKRHVTAIDEVFRVRGGATVVFAGQLVGIEMDETQRFEVVLREPAKREMSGKPLR